MAPRRVLFVMPQSPYDPGSGAALATMDIACLLAAHADRFSVRVLCTTSTEAAKPPAPLVLIAARAGDAQARVDRKGAVGKARALIRWSHRARPLRGDAQHSPAAVGLVALDTAPLHPLKWDALHAPQFNRLLMSELTAWTPDVVVTYGGSRADQLRRQAIWQFVPPGTAGGAGGAGGTSPSPAVVQMVHNLEFLHPDAFEHSDAVWVPSVYSAQRYEREAGVRATAIYPPLDPAQVVHDARDPRRVLFVSPTPAKGGYVVMRLLHELRAGRPDIPVEVIEGRATFADLCAEAARHGLAIADHPHLLITPSVPRPRDVFARARVLVMPSVWSESFGKLAAEAVMNGVPALVPSRGGLPEAIGRAIGQPAMPDGKPVSSVQPAPGFVLPLPAGLTPQATTPISSVDAAPWLDHIVRLMDDQAFYDACAASCRGVADRFTPGVLAEKYVAFFEGVRRCWTPRFGA